MKYVRLPILLLLIFPFLAFSQKVYPTMGQVIYEDAALEKLLPETSRVEVLASGFQWSEGPVWVKSGNYLLFSDVPENKIYKWDEKTGLSTFLQPSGYTGRGVYSDEPGSNGLLIDNQGRLVSCEHGDRRISAMPLEKGGKVTLAGGYEGKRFNSPNDVAQHPQSGLFYFTDPPYGLSKKHDDPTRELKEFGVYRIEADGKVTRQIADLTRPNGLAFSPDGKTLYIAQSDPEKAFIMAYPLDANGNAGQGKLIYDATPMVKAGKQGLPDGLKVDREGNLWSSGPGGLLILTSAGKLLGRIEMGALTSNCAWGDDGSTLYLTVDDYVCRIKTATKGAGW